MQSISRMSGGVTVLRQKDHTSARVGNAATSVQLN
jgi:hypothetical protein